MTPELKQAIDLLKKRGLPVTPRTEQALRDGIAKYGDKVSQDTLDQVLNRILDGVKSIAHPSLEDRSSEIGDGEKSVEVGSSPATVRADAIKSLLDDLATQEGLAQSMNLDFKIRIATEVLQGAGRFLVGQTDVDVYPAWELYRAYDRKEPRLWRGDEGTDDKTLGSEFAGRWYAAAQAAGDADAARMLQDEGRMIALKSSDIWNQLGSMFDDGLGNPYPPFAFNSGMDVDGVPRKECIELGLLDADEQPEPAKFDLKDLISFAT